MMKKLLFCSLVCLSFIACTKDGAGEQVEFYLIKGTQGIPGANGCALNISGAVLEDAPLVKNKDIYAYSPLDYTFTLSDDAINSINALRDNIPFALTINKVPVYYGLYKPAFSSSICSNVITMRWDYKHSVGIDKANPTISPSAGDPRNDPGLLLVLRRQRKLR